MWSAQLCSINRLLRVTVLHSWDLGILSLNMANSWLYQFYAEEEEEIEILVDNYLHRILNSAREMEDSVSVNLRLEQHDLNGYQAYVYL
ncbi:hypothetical protein Tco_0455441 [Tanacetum coccineum]